MRATVFRDPALTRHAGQFVWLSIDTEEAGNVVFLEKFPTEVSPTLLVIDPAAARPVLAWPGSATVPELEKLLDDGVQAVRGSAQAAADADIERGDALAAAHQAAAA